VWDGRNEQRKRETNMGAVIVMLCGAANLFMGNDLVGGCLMALGGLMQLFGSILED
jgi:hypothetical protein